MSIKGLSIGILAFWAFCTLSVKGQDKPVVAGAQVFRLKAGATHTIPGTATIEFRVEPSVASAYVSYDSLSRQFHLKADAPAKEVTITYFQLPANWQKPVVLHARSVYDSAALFDSKQKNVSSPVIPTQSFSSSGLQSTGFLSRGIAVGTNQDVFVNSALNLKLSGKLDDNLNIEANLTDNQVPYQPEGNTEQIQDFDWVSFKVYNEHFGFEAGDLWLAPTEQTHFLKYRQRVKGVGVYTQWNTDSVHQWRTGAHYAMADGKRATIWITPEDGVSGPYPIRNTGSAGFEMIVAGSEKVYLDGEPLQRGIEQDYTIDYNTGEITFMPQILITNKSRIRVDCEFANQDYARDALTLKQEFTGQKLSWYVQAYQQQDQRNQPLLVQLNDQEKERLSQLDGTSSYAMVPTFTRVKNSSDIVGYLQKDTLDAVGNPHRIFTWASSNVDSVYQVYFSPVPQGTGNYVLDHQEAFGPVYRWVAPVNGQPQGDFEPARRISLPQRQQLMEAGFTYDLSQTEQVQLQWAGSRWNTNTFAYDQANASGMAWRLGYQKRDIAVGSHASLDQFLHFTHTDAAFKTLNPFREVEYQREWGGLGSPLAGGIADNALQWNQQLHWGKQQQQTTSLTLGARRYADKGKAWQTELSQKATIGQHLQLSLKGHAMRNQLGDTLSEWYRANGNILYDNDFLVPGYQLFYEKNLLSLHEGEQKLSSLGNTESHKFFVQNPSGSHWQYQLSQTFRKDYGLYDNAFYQSDQADISQLSLQLPTQNGSHKLDLSYRKHRLWLPGSDSTMEEQYVGGRWFSSGILPAHLGQYEWNYRVSTGREARRTFIFRKVQAGRGTHTWRDDNGDGVPQWNEFYEDPYVYGERNYAKFWIPTQQYISAFTSGISLRLRGNLRDLLPEETGVLRAITWQYTGDFEKKTLSHALWQRIVPVSPKEGQNLTYRNHQQAQVFFNRTGEGYCAELSFSTQDRKQLIGEGYEANQEKEWRWKQYYRGFQHLTAALETIKGQQNASSDVYNNRTYAFTSWEWSPELTWNPGTQWAVTSDYRWAYHHPLTPESAQKYNVHLQAEELKTQYQMALKHQVMVSLQWLQLDYQGEANSPLGYQMLEGLQPGTNWIWQCNWQSKVWGNMQLSLHYLGRKSPGHPIYHVGGVQLTAQF